MDDLRINPGGLVFMGDLHLQPRIWKHKPLHGDAYYSWLQILDFCVEHQANLILLGDVLDTQKPDSGTVKELLDGLKKVRDAGGTIAAIQGQHDISEPPWVSLGGKDHSVVRLTLGNVLTIQGLRIAGLDYTPAPQLESALESITHCDILCMHQLLQEVCAGGEGDITLDRLSSIASSYGISMVAMGDYHESAVLMDNPLVFYTGSSCIQSIREHPEKFFMYWDIQKLRLIPIPLITRRIVKLHINSEEELERVLSTLYRPELDTALRTLVYIKYPPTLSTVHEQLVSKCKEYGYVLWEDLLSISSAAAGQNVPEDADDLEDADLEDMDDYLSRWVPVNSTAYSYIRSILDSDDPRKEISDRRPDSVRKLLEERAV